MAKNFQEIMAEARKEVPEVTAQQVNELLKNNGKSPVLLDVRESDEWRQGHLEGALPLPRGFLEIKVENTVPDKNSPIIAYCAGGVRSLLAAKVMKEMGYQNVSSMAGGYAAWKNGGFKWVQDFQYTPDQLIRYSRHFLLPEVGEEGQAKLLQAKVLMVGAGGLGSPSAYYLAAAGVGTIGIIDNDVVDVSNLHGHVVGLTRQQRQRQCRPERRSSRPSSADGRQGRVSGGAKMLHRRSEWLSGCHRRDAP